MTKNGGKKSVGGKKTIGRTKGSAKKQMGSQSIAGSNSLTEQELEFIQAHNPDSNETTLTLTQEAKLQGSLKKKRNQQNQTPYGEDFDYKVENPLISKVEVNYSLNRIDKANKFRNNPKIQQTIDKIGLEEFEKRTKLKKDQKDYIPKAWYDYYINYVLDEDQKRIVKEYEESEKIPLLIPIRAKSTTRASDDLISFHKIKELPHVTKAVEKPLNNDNSSRISMEGQQLQASIDDDLRFKGLYYQDGSQDKPLLHLANFDYIDLRKDQDDTAHYSAYFSNYYIYNDPLRKNVDFGKRDSNNNIIWQSADEFRALRFFAKQIINSSAFRRNKAIEDAIIFSIGSSLVYRNSSGEDKSVTISDQKLAICDYLYSNKAVINVVTPDSTIMFRKFKTKELPENEKPVLKFQWDNKKFEPLDSFTLLRVAVKEFGLEPVSVQAILENLYRSDWINYPRANQEKIMDEPIYVKVGPNFGNRTINDYEGTTQEKEILNLIYQAESSNYIKKGTWNLYYGDEIIASSEGEVLGDNPMEYTDDAFDIQITRQGKTPEELTRFLTHEKINTPATQTMQLSELQQAGIITLSNGTYNLDKRGVVLKSAYDFVKKHSFDAITLLRQIDAVDRSEGVKGFKKVLNEIKPIGRYESAKLISDNALKLIREQDDLAELEAF